MLFSEAKRRIEGTPGDVSDVPAAPRASVHRQLPWLGKSLIGSEIDRSAGAPRILFEEQAARGCWFAAAEDAAVEAHCVSYADAVPRPVTGDLVASERPDDVLVGTYTPGYKGYEIWSLVAGRRLLSNAGMGRGGMPSWVTRDGAWGVVTSEKNERFVVREGAEAVTPISPPGKDGLKVVGDTLLSYDGDKGLLFAQVVEGAGTLGAPVEVGALPRAREEGRCVAGGSAFVRFEDRLAVRTGGRWSLVEVPAPDEAMTCDEGGATFVGVGRKGHGDARLDVRRTRCTSEACKSETASLELDTSTNEHEVAAAAVGERVLLAWNAHSDGGVRVRLAPLAELPKVRDRVVYDNTTVGSGKLVHSVGALGVGAAGVVLIMSEAVVGVAVDAEGRVTPLRVVEVP